MTDPLDALEEADRARTPGEWKLWGTTPRSSADAQFLLAASIHVPTLLAELRAARAVCEGLSALDGIVPLPVDEEPIFSPLADALAKWREVHDAPA